MCLVWRISRRLRITASNVKRVPKRLTTSFEKAVNTLTNPTFQGNATTRHGCHYEPVARLQFSKSLSLCVIPCGTLVSIKHPWLSPTPDGIIQSHDAILDIKCPVVADCHVLVASGKHDVKRENCVDFLAKSGPNGYYSQVQYSMLCANKSLCFFYAWSVNNQIIVEVPFDPDFVQETAPRLERFYFCGMLPKLEKMFQ